MFAFSRMSDFPKVLGWSQGPVSNPFCVCQLSQRLVTWLVSWSFTVTGAKKPSTTVTKRWAHVQPLPTSPRWSGLHSRPSPYSKRPSLTLLMSLYLFHAWFLFLLKKKKIGSDLYFQLEEVKYTSTGTHQEFSLVFFCGWTDSRFLYWL